VVPFLVDEFLQSNHAFWRTPSAKKRRRENREVRRIRRWLKKKKKSRRIWNRIKYPLTLLAVCHSVWQPDWQPDTPDWHQQDQDLQVTWTSSMKATLQGDDSSPLSKDWGASIGRCPYWHTCRVSGRVRCAVRQSHRSVCCGGPTFNLFSPHLLNEYL